MAAEEEVAATEKEEVGESAEGEDERKKVIKRPKANPRDMLGFAASIAGLDKARTFARSQMSKIVLEVSLCSPMTA